MRAISYDRNGDSDVLRLVDRPDPTPGPGQVRVAVAFSGVNPTDWKRRRGTPPGGEQVPNQDGSGVVDAVGEGVDPARVGQRVWVWEAAWHSSGGTAAERVVVAQEQAVPLPDAVSLELGACLGIPFITAHRALTVAEAGPHELAPGALAGRTVLVAGGAGAVGNAAIQLARWAGARVLTTVSSPAKAAAARAAGAHDVVDYKASDAVAEVRRLAPDGVDIVVEVAPTANAELDVAVLAPNGVVSTYADTGPGEVTLPVRALMTRNVRWQFVLVYTMPRPAKQAAVRAVGAAVAAGAVGVGPEHGIELLRFPLERTADAHDAVEGSTVGKVLIEVGRAG